MNIFRKKKSLNNDKKPIVFIGLGNPGEKYLHTRHNSGFLALDYFADKHNIKIKKIKCKAIIGEKRLFGEDIVLVKPQTYMNRSGTSVREVLGNYGLKDDPGRLFVIYDDVDIDTGAVRIRKKGSGGTHNGMRDIIKCIKTDEFPRIRTGIGKPPEYMDIADYVLSNFNDTEKETVFKAFGKISECMETIIKEGIDVAMNRFNKKDD